MRTALFVILLMVLSQPAWSQDSDRARVLERRITVAFTDAPFRDVVDHLRRAVRVNIVVLAPRQIREAKVTLKLKNVTVRTVLKILLKPRGLSASWQDEVVVIRAENSRPQPMVVRLYDIRPILAKAPDYPGPDVELKGLVPLTAFPIGCLMVWDFPAIGCVFTENWVEDLVLETGGRSWDENCGASVEMLNGYMVVSQTPAVHREIKSLLSRLEGYR